MTFKSCNYFLYTYMCEKRFFANGDLGPDFAVIEDSIADLSFSVGNKRD